MARPIAFEVIHNGRNLCTAGLRGAPGVLSVIVHWVDRKGQDDLAVHVGALNSDTMEGLTWVPERRIRIGDEVAIRVIETERTTRVRKRSDEDPKSREKDEKKWLRQTAKKYGYRLVKA